MEDLYLNVLNKTLEEMNEQERNRQNLELILQKEKHEMIENYLIKRNEIKRENQRQIRRLYETNNDLSNNILQEENEHKLKIKEMKNNYDIEIQKMYCDHKEKMYTLEI
jgi:hypothetical protein